MTLPEAHPRDAGWLWFGMLGGPVIWAIHFLTIWVIGELGCRAGLVSREIAGFSAVKALVLIATAIAILPVIYGGLVAFQNKNVWRGAAEDGDYGYENRDRDRRYFMAVTGAIMSFVFVIVMLFTALPVFFLDACMSMTGG